MGKRHYNSRYLTWGQILQLYVQASRTQGFVLPMVTLFGIILVTLMTAFLIGAQSNLESSRLRQSASGSNLVADSAIARVMAELSKPENSVLLTRDYDPINPDSNRTYLGPDGTPNSADEENAAIDEWSGFSPANFPCFQEIGQANPDIQLSGTIGDGSTYQILAYRYNPKTESGNVLIEGTHQGIASTLLVSITVTPDLENFPGLGLIRPANDPDKRASLALRGRQIIGDRGNVYFDPLSSPDTSVSGRSEQGDATRPAHLDAIFSSPVDDGATQDSVQAKIVVCDLNINIPFDFTSNNQGIDAGSLGSITTSTIIEGRDEDIPTVFRFDDIILENNEILTIDTTNGPVILEGIFTNPKIQISLSQNAQIRNIRTDGQPAQVGDARIMMGFDGSVQLHDTTCMDNVFLYSLFDILQILTSGPGCPSNQNTNFEGVVWAEAILAAKNNASNRDINYLGIVGNAEDTTILPGVTSGIAVPNNLSSLVDLLEHTQLPVHYRFGRINSWQQVNL